MTAKKPLGWREWIAFPTLNISKVKAKVDTGARTSALHAFKVEPFIRDSQQWVRFAIHPLQWNSDTVVECEAVVKDQRIVRDSGGHEELRYVVDAQIVIGEDLLLCEFTLTDRDSMAFRVLLGRTALRARYVIHPGKSYMQGKPSGRHKGAPSWQRNRSRHPRNSRSAPKPGKCPKRTSGCEIRRDNPIRKNSCASSGDTT